jgi:hypothetical protein
MRCWLAVSAAAIRGIDPSRQPVLVVGLYLAYAALIAG